MSVSEVTIYNWALSAIGSAGRVQSADEKGEAEVCKLWFEIVRDQILRSAPWDSAKAHKRLAVSVDRTSEEGSWLATDPAPGWQYAYSAPSDMIAPRFLSTYSMFTLGTNSDNQRVIYTNEPAAILVYTKRQTNYDLWEPDLIAAVGFGLAAHIAMPLTGDVDKVRLTTAQAMDKIMTARENSANVPNFIQDSVPEWIAARGYALATSSPRYMHPYAEFTVMGNSVALN